MGARTPEEAGRARTPSLWATDRVRHLPLVASSMQSSNTGGATPLRAAKRVLPPLFDDGAALRRPDGDPRPGPSAERSMSFYRGMTCENVTINGDKGTPITKLTWPGHLVLSPLSESVVLVHHLPGWSEFYIETTRRFAHHGHLAICANLYEREGGGTATATLTTSPPRCAPRAALPTPQMMVGDTEAAVKWIRAQPDHNGKVGLIGGSCSGGRHGFIYACRTGRTSMPASERNGGAAW